MAFKMKGYNYPGKSPVKQYKGKNYESSKGDQQGPIPKGNLPLQPGEHKDTWVYGASEIESDKKRVGSDFVTLERINDYDERAGYLEQNDMHDSDWFLGGAKKSDSKAVKNKAAKKGAQKRKNMEQAVKTLDREAQIMRDRRKNTKKNKK